jgi:hypothetical protein
METILVEPCRQDETIEFGAGECSSVAFRANYRVAAVRPLNGSTYVDLLPSTAPADLFESGATRAFAGPAHGLMTIEAPRELPPFEAGAEYELMLLRQTHTPGA